MKIRIPPIPRYIISLKKRKDEKIEVRAAIITWKGDNVTRNKDTQK